jgi:SNF2-related domain
MLRWTSGSTHPQFSRVRALLLQRMCRSLMRTHRCRWEHGHSRDMASSEPCRRESLHQQIRHKHQTVHWCLSQLNRPPGAVPSMWTHFWLGSFDLIKSRVYDSYTAYAPLSATGFVPPSLPRQLACNSWKGSLCVSTAALVFDMRTASLHHECLADLQCLTGRQRPSSADADDVTGTHMVTQDMGAILADEMGLGKTIQVLAASWALMQRFERDTRPAVRKMLVVAPSSVINNWGQEIKKWLGMERAAYLVLLPGPEANNQVCHSQP